MAYQKRARTTRAQETRDNDSVRETHGDNWEEPSLLSAPKPRPGYVQRWVRTKLNGVDDPNNLVKRLNQGWQPRLAETAPDNYKHLSVVHDGANVIGIHGMLLMERPEEVHNQHAQRTNAATRNQMRAVDENLFKAHQPGRGFEAPTMKESSRVEVGRPVTVADD